LVDLKVSNQFFNRLGRKQANQGTLLVHQKLAFKGCNISLMTIATQLIRMRSITIGAFEALGNKTIATRRGEVKHIGIVTTSLWTIAIQSYLKPVGNPVPQPLVLKNQG
jgi:hypothetical protein